MVGRGMFGGEENAVDPVYTGNQPTRSCSIYAHVHKLGHLEPQKTMWLSDNRPHMQSWAVNHSAQSAHEIHARKTSLLTEFGNR
jgi:hypothetical protein